MPSWSAAANALQKFIDPESRLYGAHQLVVLEVVDEGVNDLVERGLVFSAEPIAQEKDVWGILGIAGGGQSASGNDAKPWGRWLVAPAPADAKRGTYWSRGATEFRG